MDEKNPFEKLFVDEQTATEELQRRIGEASEIFVIERETGRVIFKNFEKLSDNQRVAVILLGRYVAKKSGLDVSDTLGPSEIGRNIGKSRTSISGPITKLKSLGFIEAQSGVYRINPHMVGKVVDFIVGREKYDGRRSKTQKPE